MCDDRPPQQPITCSSLTLTGRETALKTKPNVPISYSKTLNKRYPYADTCHKEMMKLGLNCILSSKNLAAITVPDPERATGWKATYNENQGFSDEESDSTKDRNWLHSSILDKSAFNKCNKTLSNNKSPGPDAIVNELLRMLPAEIQETIHMLFIIMWATASRQKLGISAKLVVLVLY